MKTPVWQKLLAREIRKRAERALKSVEEAPVTDQIFLNVFNSGIMVHLPTLKRAAARIARQYIKK